MARTTVIDLSHFDRPTFAEVPPAARRLAAYMGSIVQAATASPSGEIIATPLPCRRRPRRKPCRGRLVVRRQDVPAEIHWRCPVCEDAGVIVGWRGTFWDLGRHPSYHDPEEEAEMASLVLSTEGFRLLKTVTTVDPDVERMIAAARLTENGVELSGRIEDFEELAGYVASEANHTKNRRRQRELDSIYDVIDRVLTP